MVVLGAADYSTTSTFGAFWVRGEQVVGAFLEGGSIEQQIAVAQVWHFPPRVWRETPPREIGLYVLLFRG